MAVSDHSAEGAASIATPGPRHLQEIRRLALSALTEVRAQEIDGPFLQNPFNTNHAAEELPLTFGRVESFIRAGLLEVPAVDPVVAHVDSQQGPDLDAFVPPSARWEDVLQVAGGMVAEIIQADGAFRVTTEVGAFVCRP